ncbi:hypothetical protein V6N11_051332 [Hibiscus sabdariffa]|uniref:Uncharacterized protein n=1 Tax=Hibiscus sabdariffa TaxID=183260 RepID=A0ABR1ZVS5_9ROSI
MLEQHGSPISEEKQPATKRGRCEVESELNDVVDGEHMDADFDTTMRGTESCNRSTNGQVHAENLREEPKQIENGDSTVKLSFRDTLMVTNRRKKTLGARKNLARNYGEGQANGSIRSRFTALQEIQDEDTNVNYVEPTTLTQQPKDDSSHRQTMARRSEEPAVILENKQSCSILPQ